MKDFKIFVEGIADQIFIRQYIAFIKGINEKEIPEKGIIKCGGKANLCSDEVINQLKTAIDNGIIPLIIFDADSSVQETQKEIKRRLKPHNISPEQYALFLFPNNKDSGDLETLLERIIPPNNQSILKCWNKYERCLEIYATPLVRPIPLRPLTTPARKTKIYGYLEVLLGESQSEKKKIKEANRNYHNNDHWDLQSSTLNSLKELIDQYL